MIKNILLIFVVVVLAACTTAQDATTSASVKTKIQGPLVTITKDSFVDTLLVLLQSHFYNNNTFQLDPHTATTTVLGVDLVINFTGILTVVEEFVGSRIVTGGGEHVNYDLTVTKLLVEKQYSMTSVQDPTYLSNGTISLTVTDSLFHNAINTGQKPYFVDGVRYLVKGDMAATLEAEGIPIAEEIQESLKQIVIDQFISTDNRHFFTEIYRKLDSLFKNNELRLCMTCNTMSDSYYYYD